MPGQRAGQKIDLLGLVRNQLGHGEPSQIDGDRQLVVAKFPRLSVHDGKRTDIVTIDRFERNAEISARTTVQAGGASGGADIGQGIGYDQRIMALDGQSGQGVASSNGFG